MNFEEFKQQLMEDLKEALSRRVGTEVAVEENEVQKLQQESYDGIVVRKENESIGVNMDATRLYSDLEQGKSYEDVLHYAVDVVQRGFEETPNFDISQLILPGGSCAYGIPGTASDVTDTDETGEVIYSNDLSELVRRYRNGTVTLSEVVSAVGAQLPVIPLCYRSGVLFYSNDIGEIKAASADDLFMSLEN